MVGLVLSCVMVAVLCYYFGAVWQTNSEFRKRYDARKEVALRKFPYPYRAGLAISSDCDNLETLAELVEIQTFMSTKEMTSMGRGLGLDFAYNFFFFEPVEEAISYYHPDGQVAPTLRKLIRAGDIDAIHSFGKKKDFVREDAVRAIQEMRRERLEIEVWIDHTQAIDNLGDDVTFGEGDHPESAAYHADLTLAYGINFVWMGRISMLVGQVAPIGIGSFMSLFDKQHALASCKNIGKELAKNVLGVFGSGKYAIHGTNDLLKISELDDGQKVYEFVRFDNHWKGVAAEDNARGLEYLISERNLGRLKEVGGYMIVYTHLGKNKGYDSFIPEGTITALRHLAEEGESGAIYITKTSKLLNYYLAQKYLEWSYEVGKDSIRIVIGNINDPLAGEIMPSKEDLEGFTFYVPVNTPTEIYVGGQRMNGVVRNRADHTGKESVTIKEG